MFRTSIFVYTLIVLASLGGCRKDPVNGTHEARLNRFEVRATRGEKRLTAAELKLAELRLQVTELEQQYRRVNSDYDRAARALHAAAENFGQASQEYARARDAYHQAARTWRLVSVTLMVAAASDSLGALCEGQRSTAAMRREWKQQGIDLDGVDVDHIWPKSRGGADHPWNYQAMESRLNRSLGNDLWWKLQHQPIAMLRGAVVSAVVMLRCGG